MYEKRFLEEFAGMFMMYHHTNFHKPTPVVHTTEYRLVPVGWDSVVGIVTRYCLDSPGTESRWGEIFHTHPDRPWGPPSLLYNGHLGLFTRGTVAGAWRWPPTHHLVLRLKEE
jgi:hypothetical protein